eukprot:CAMPEP_0115850318 /NCGR_PEP_ID=MMETSP0287-20121206/11903_1 /TAXON_ID=412157 /ORGANISM="Chrysochromulina rotalis, Strain UIO044" /LENGTH=162 /DNA_ID=CAMNT_0003304313 /DNA_START=294 /DNA_END=780 /DNA_ORIENTATION=-
MRRGAARPPTSALLLCACTLGVCGPPDGSLSTSSTAPSQPMPCHDHLTSISHCATAISMSSSLPRHRPPALLAAGGGAAPRTDSGTVHVRMRSLFVMHPMLCVLGRLGLPVSTRPYSQSPLLPRPRPRPPWPPRLYSAVFTESALASASASAALASPSLLGR